MNTVNGRFGASGERVLDKAYNPSFVLEEADTPEWPKDKPVNFPHPFPTLSHWTQAFHHRLDSYGSTADLVETADLVIIGSGLTGSSAAFHLLKASPDLKIVMLEARAYCSGATGRNGGHLDRPDGFDFRADWEAVGEKEFLAARKLISENVKAIISHVNDRQLAENVDMCWQGGVQLFGSAEERDSVARNLAFMESVGVKHTTTILSPEGMSEKFECENLYGGMFSPESGTIWPRKFCAEMIEEVLQTCPEQFSLFTYTCATDVKSIPDADQESYRWEIKTNRGSVKARSVLHATNAWMCALLPEMMGTPNQVIPDRETVVAARPAPSTESAGTWPYNVMATNGFHYLAQMPKRAEDDRENVVIYGLGEERNSDDDSTLSKLAPEHLAAMTKFLGHAFPKKFSKRDHTGAITNECLENIWSGLVGRTLNGRPVVGPVAGKPGQFTAAGYNGAGMGKCYLTGKAVVDLIQWELQKQAGKDVERWKCPEYYPEWFLSNLDEL